MSISMIGIDHNMAPVDIRALFAFTKKNAGEAMEKIKKEKGIYGCVILSTCNRLEIWVSRDDETEISLYDNLCRMKGIQDQSYESYFIEFNLHISVRSIFMKMSDLIIVEIGSLFSRNVLFSPKNN